MEAASPSDDDEGRADRELLQSYSGREATIRALGSACLILAGLIVIWAFVFLALMAVMLRPQIARGEVAPATWIILVVGVVYNLVWGWLGLLMGRGLRQFLPRARWASLAILVFLMIQTGFAGVLAWGEDGPLASLGVALCLVAPAAIVALLLTPRTAMVFSPTYRGAISRTPSHRTRLGLLAWATAIVLLGLFALGVALAVIAIRRH